MFQNEILLSDVFFIIISIFGYEQALGGHLVVLFGTHSQAAKKRHQPVCPVQSVHHQIVSGRKLEK